MLHKNLVLVERHASHCYEYANSAARTGATGFTSDDVGKLAWQKDSNTFWVLTATTPTWSNIGTSVVWGDISGTLSNQTDLNSALSGKSATGHNHTGVYEPADATIVKDADIGVTVAAQAHNHAGVYEPADATIVKDADIGVSVAAQGHNHAGVYEPADATILKDADIGVNVAAQAHNHSGVYEPADATIVKDADIGVSVAAQGHNHDHGALTGLADDDHTLYALTNPTYSAVTYNNGATTTVTVNGRNEIFSTTAVIGSTTWAFAGAAASGSVSSFVLELTNGGSQTQIWPASAKWDAGTAPTLTVSGLDILTFYTRNGGTTWRGFLAAADSK